MLVVVYKIGANVIMWSSIMAPQGPNFPSSFLNPKGAKLQHHRDFSMFAPSLPIAPGKSFKNPNFVNNFNKYQNNLKPVDSSTTQNNLVNSCQIHIIDSIKEKCPEVIPSVEGQEKSFSVTESTGEMCLDHTPIHKQRKREYTPKLKKHMGKKSRQNLKRKEIIEMMQEDNSQDLSNHSLDSSFSPKPHSLILRDFIAPKPMSDIHPPLTKLEHIEIPIFKGPEMLVTITNTVLPPNRARHFSVTDSEDSFVIFDHDGKEDTEDNSPSCNNDVPCCRTRVPSTCESEDSFIMFDRDDLDSLEDDTSYQSSSEDSDQESDSCLAEESGSSWAEESGCDDVDSSFSIVNQKKVRFASDDKLCEVHPMIKWSYAYQAARKGPWEMYARDRSRFKERAHRVERDIKQIFDPQHRATVFKERFENL